MREPCRISEIDETRVHASKPDPSPLADGSADSCRPRGPSANADTEVISHLRLQVLAVQDLA